MDGPNVSQLCEMLDTIWAELPGQEVIYQWVEWVRNYSLAYLWCDDKITLGPDIPCQRADNRAISRNLPLESVLSSMHSYNSEKRYQAFLEDMHMCMICLNQSKGKNFTCPLMPKYYSLFLLMNCIRSSLEEYHLYYGVDCILYSF
jgi:E3 ubiquitin-protein ligase RNF14